MWKVLWNSEIYTDVTTENEITNNINFTITSCLLKWPKAEVYAICFPPLFFNSVASSQSPFAD